MIAAQHQENRWREENGYEDAGLGEPSSPATSLHQIMHALALGPKPYLLALDHYPGDELGIWMFVSIGVGASARYPGKVVQFTAGGCLEPPSRLNLYKAFDRN